MNFSTTISGVAQKNGGHAETPRQMETNMLQVAEKADKAKLLTKVGSEYITASPDRKAAEWLEGHIAKSQDKITTIVADLTPALARVLLNRNDGNRKISASLAAALARDIESGAWALNGEPIIISKDGKLNDGQHRCDAVIQADKAIPMVFVVGVGRDTRITVDQGRAKTGGDYLAMEGHLNANHLGAAASHYWQFKTFGYLARGSRQRATKGEVVTTVTDNPDLAKSVSFCQFKNINLVGGPSLLGFIHYALCKASSRPTVNEFVQSLATGEGLFARNPILYARNRLMLERGRLRPNLKAELIFKAWNAHRKGETLRHLVLSGNALPKLEK